MKRVSTKNTLLLLASPAILLGFGFMRPTKPTLRLKSVHIRPVIDRSTGKVMKKEVLAVDVLAEYSDPSFFARFSEGPGTWFNVREGLYIEDEHGRVYGKAYSPQDSKTYRPFVSKYGPYGVGNGDASGNPYAWSFTVPLYQIPKSAGTLRLKTILESGSPDAPVQLPISIVVHE